MTLGEIKAILRTALGRGTSLDSTLGPMIKVAVRQIERKRPWQYMFSLKTLPYDASADSPTRQKIAGVSIRNVDFIRTSTRDTYYSMIDPKQVSGSQTDSENAYWLENGNTIVWAYDFGVSQDFEVGLFSFTDVADDDNFTCWLFDVGADVVIGQTLIQMSDLVRNSAMAQTYINNLAMNASGLEQADDDLKFSNRTLQMRH